MNVGRHIIDAIYDRMRIDAQWSVRDDCSFTWWGHRLAQRVAADPPRRDNGFDVVRIRAETALLRDVADADELDTAEKVSGLNAVATMSAYVWDPQLRTLSSRCTVYAHQETADDYIVPLLAAAVALQAADSHQKVDVLARAIGGRPDESSHPVSGQRQDPDDMLNVLQMFAYDGNKPSPFAAQDFERIEALLIDAGVMATHSSTGITAEFAFIDNVFVAERVLRGIAGGPTTSLLQAGTEVQHPQLGSGLLMVLKLPIDWPWPAAVACVRLNLVEASEEFARAQFLGAWCLDAGRGPGIAFVSFAPAVLYRPGLLDNLVLSMGTRSRWAADFLERDLRKIAAP